MFTSYLKYCSSFLTSLLHTFLHFSDIISCSQDDILKIKICSDHSLAQHPSKPSHFFESNYFLLLLTSDIILCHFPPTFCVPTAFFQFLKLRSILTSSRVRQTLFLQPKRPRCHLPSIPPQSLTVTFLLKKYLFRCVIFRCTV